MFQLNRSAFEVAEILQALLERAQMWRFFRRSPRATKRRLAGLLCSPAPAL
jgi:hypothetical protein